VFALPCATTIKIDLFLPFNVTFLRVHQFLNRYLLKQVHLRTMQRSLFSWGYFFAPHLQKLHRIFLPFFTVCHGKSDHFGTIQVEEKKEVGKNK